MLENHPAPASSIAFFSSTKSLTVDVMTGEERERHPASFQKFPVAALLLGDHAERRIAVLRRGKFKSLVVFDSLCGTAGRKSENQYVSGGDGRIA